MKRTPLEIARAAEMERRLARKVLAHVREHVDTLRRFADLAVVPSHPDPLALWKLVDMAEESIWV